MAPGSGAANALLKHRPRPSAAKNIVPAIPLPYIQRRKQNAVAPKKVENEPTPTLPPVTPVSLSPSVEPEIVATVSNGSPETIISGNGGNQSLSAAVTNSEVDDNGNVEFHEDSEVSPIGQTEEPAIQSPVVASSDQQSSGSRSTYNMPPAFVPASQGHPKIATTADAVKFPRQPSFGGQHPMHQIHPSTSSLIFGGYPESNTSSPAPPPSAGGTGQFPTQSLAEGGFVQAAPYNNGGHVHSFSNDYSPMGPPSGYYPQQDGLGNQNHGTESFFAQRQMGGPALHDGYSPSGTPAGNENQRFPPTFDPSTPHSFHDSQSSAPDANGPQIHSQYSTAVILNGNNGHIDDVRLYPQPRTKGRTGSQPLAVAQGSNMPQPLMPPTMDNLDGLVGYIQSQFAEPQFADYTLELRYSDDRAPPVRIPGHNLIFARSPALKNLMTAQAQESNGDGVTLRTLFIESIDRFLRSDGFSMAVQRLYGGPLLDPGASAVVNMPAMPQLSANMPGTPADRFELALGYAAAGHVLQMQPVVNRGIDIASHFISWLTLEKALDFALDGGLDSQWTLESNHSPESYSTYGPAVNMIIHSALTFVITLFPPNFELDTDVGEPVYNRRIPLVLENRSAPANPRLSSIKFGDHHCEDTSRSNGTSITTTLSRVLLNLPFQLLKYVLESSRLGNVHGWATAELRKKVMRTVVDEREKRRNKVRDNRNVTNAERSANRKEWDAVGWQEGLVPIPGTPDTSSLHRTWVDFIVHEDTIN